MFQHRQEDKLLGALVQLRMARQMTPPWESNNITKRGGRAARRNSAAAIQTQKYDLPGREYKL